MVGHLQKDTTLTKIFVGGLPYHTTDDSLRCFFEQFGPIEEAVVITDRQTGKSRGYGFVTMARSEDALLAIRDPNPCIDGRKANVNLAVLGAKPRLMPGANPVLPTFFPLQTGLAATDAAGNPAGLYGTTNSGFMNPLLAAGLLPNFGMPTAAAATSTFNGLIPAPGAQLPTVGTHGADARLSTSLSLSPLNNANMLLNYPSTANGNPAAVTCASQFSPAALALLMSAYGHGAVTLGTTINGNPYLGQPSLGALHPATSLLTLSPTTPNTLPLQTGAYSSSQPMPVTRNLGPDVSAGTDLNAYSTAVAYQRLLGAASSGYTPIQSPLLAPTGGLALSQAATGLNGSVGCATPVFGYSGTSLPDPSNTMTAYTHSSEVMGNGLHNPSEPVNGQAMTPGLQHNVIQSTTGQAHMSLVSTRDETVECNSGPVLYK